MPSKYSHSVVLANYSRRGIISLPNEEKPENQRALKAPRILPGKPPPHEPIFTVTLGGGASSRSSYQARSSTWQPRFPGRRLSKGRRNIIRDGIPTSQPYPLEDESSSVRVRKTTDDTRPHTSERKTILGSESEETVNGIQDNDFWLRTSGPSNAKSSTGSRLTSPSDLYVESLGLALRHDPSGAQAKPADHTKNGILKHDRKQLPSVAAQKYESGRSFGVAFQPPDGDDLRLHQRPRPLQHGGDVPLVSARDSTVSPRSPEIRDPIYPRRHLAPPKTAQDNDTTHHAPVVDAADPNSKPKKPRWPPLNRANTSFIDMSDDEISSKSRPHTPHTSQGKSPSTFTLISETEAPDSTVLNLGDDLRGLRGGVAFGARQGRWNRFENAPTWKGGVAEPQVQRRPVSMGSGPFEAPPLQKRATLRRRQTEELPRHSISRSPVLEPRSLSWLLLDVGLNNQWEDDRYDEAQSFPQIALQLPKSQARAKVSNASLGSSVAQPRHARFEPVEADFTKIADGNESEKPDMDSPIKNIYFHRHNNPVRMSPPQANLDRKPPTPLSPSQLSRRGEEPLWSPNSARSEPTSVESVNRHQHTFSNISSCSVVPETQLQPYPDVKGLASPGQSTLMSKLKSEEDMRMKIPTPIPSPAVSMSPEMSGRRMVWSSSGSAHQASRPANVPEFGVPSLLRPDDQATYIQDQTMSRPASQLGPGTSQKQRAGPETIRKPASFPRLPRMASTPRPGNVVAPANAIGSYEQDNDDWTFPNIPVSKEAASRASLLDLLATNAEAESRLKSKPSRTWQEHSPNLGRQYQDVTRHIGHSGDMDDITPLFANDHEIPIDVRDYAHQPHAAGDEIEDSDAALPPPDISRYRTERTSSRNRQYRRSQSSLTALPRIASTNVSLNRLSLIKREDGTESMFWAWNTKRPAFLSARADIPQEKGEKRPRMRNGMKVLWGRLRRCVES